MIAVRVSLRSPDPQVPWMWRSDLFLEVHRLGEGLAGFRVRHLPAPVHVRDPFVDPLRRGSDLLSLGLREALGTLRAGRSCAFVLGSSFSCQSAVSQSVGILGSACNRLQKEETAHLFSVWRTEAERSLQCLVCLSSATPNISFPGEDFQGNQSVTTGRFGGYSGGLPEAFGFPDSLLPADVVGSIRCWSNGTWTHLSVWHKRRRCGDENRWEPEARKAVDRRPQDTAYFRYGLLSLDLHEGSQHTVFRSMVSRGDGLSAAVRSAVVDY